ncbi:MAG TPA: extracellular solute-binding protein [Chloroflexota bacterium]|nr:extracellular solute-binding protein [Chloroflexota bacterium]
MPEATKPEKLRGIRGLAVQRAGALALLVALSTFPSLIAAACAPKAAQTSSNSAPQAAEWNDPQWTDLIAAARREGKVVIAAGGEPSRSYPPLLDVFSQRYGVTAEMTTGNATETVNRLLAERSSGVYTVDVGLIAHNTSQRRLVPAGALTPVEPLLIHPEVTDKSLWYRGRYWFADEEQQYVFLYSGKPEDSWRFWYNSERLSPAEVATIKSLQDFFDPKWRGKHASLAISDPSGLASLIRLYLAPEAGPDWVHRFIYDSDVTFTGDRRVLETWLTQGRYPLVFPAGGTDELVDLQNAGLPIKEGQIPKQTPGLQTPSSASSIEAFDHAPHPNAAQLFVNWFLSKDGQSQVQKIDGALFGSMRDDIGYGNIDPSARRKPGVVYEYEEAEPWRAEAANAAVAQIQEWWDAKP